MIVARIPNGNAINAVGKIPNPIFCDWKNQVNRMVIIAPNDINSPCAKFANRSIA